eukprot:3958386-Alexandrium_andersonii.AAC.1
MVPLRRLRGGCWVIRGQRPGRSLLPGHRMPLNRLPGRAIHHPKRGSQACGPGLGSMPPSAVRSQIHTITRCCQCRAL